VFEISAIYVEKTLAMISRGAEPSRSNHVKGTYRGASDLFPLLRCSLALDLIDGHQRRDLPAARSTSIRIISKVTRWSFCL